MTPRISFAAGFLLVLSVCLGCGSAHESGVSGTVYLDEQPLPRGTVTFFPSAGGAAVYGQIAADGAYRLSTGSVEGLKPGEYKVTVVANEEPPPTAPGETPPITRRITPEKYSRLEQTDLEVTVERGSNRIDLHLTSP